MKQNGSSFSNTIPVGESVPRLIHPRPPLLTGDNALKPDSSPQWHGGPA
jgi:hypothetical protein